MSLIERTFRVAAVALAAVAFTACATGEEAPTVVGDAPAYGTVHLALSAEHGDLAERVELRFDPVGEGEPIVDEFALGADASLASRNYRLPPGDYDISAVGFGADGDRVLEGSAPRTNVQPGDNVVALLLSPTGEDLADVYVTLDSPSVAIGYVATDGDAREGGLVRIQVRATVVDDEAPIDLLGVTGRVFVEGPDGERPLIDVEFAGDPDEPLRFDAQLPADWLGEARLEVHLLEDGAVADRTSKAINGHPSAETMEMVRAVSEVLVQDDDGTFRPIGEPIVTESGFALEGEGLDALNAALTRMNDAAIEGDFALGVGNVPAALVYASFGYWGCVAKVLQCEVLTAACIAAAPAAAAGCAAVCVETAGLGCVACIATATGGVVAVCGSAYDCWVEARRQGCL